MLSKHTDLTPYMHPSPFLINPSPEFCLTELRHLNELPIKADK